MVNNCVYPPLESLHIVTTYSQASSSEQIEAREDSGDETPLSLN